MQRGVHGAAVVLGAAVDVGCGHRGLAGDRGITKRGIEAGVLVGDGDELRRLAAVRMGLGDCLLVEADLRARGEEDVIDAGLGHRRDDGVTVVIGRDFDPGAVLVAQTSDVLVHGALPWNVIPRNANRLSRSSSKFKPRMREFAAFTLGDKRDVCPVRRDGLG